MIRARIHRTNQGWRADLIKGGEAVRTFYHPQWTQAFAWAEQWLKMIDDGIPLSPRDLKGYIGA